MTEAGRPLVACLLPVRDGAAHLFDWFETVRPFADTVIALDDGSVDDSAALLANSDLVAVLLKNPRRDSYRGWDDAANRNRLLAAAADIRPRWIMQLDADERIDRDDALALRQFLETDATPGSAYSFQVFRMIGDRDHWDRATLWVARLFAFEAGQEFPHQRLHLRQVPTSIPPSRTHRTTVRIQHLASLTQADREARFRKYQEADPGNVHQPRYASLLDPPSGVRAWEPRPPALPVVVNGRGETLRVAAPAMSAVVIARDDADTIEGSLRTIDQQRADLDLDIVVVVSGSPATAAAARRAVPDGHVVEHAPVLLPGEARNLGLARASGTVVTFPGSHVTICPGSLAARLAAHRRGYAMVTGTIRNGTDTRAGWAAYFLEHADNLPGLPAEELAYPPSSCSYLRAALEWAGCFPAVRSAEDTAVNDRLYARGYGALRDPAIELVHRNPCRTTRDFVRHQRIRGRGWGHLMQKDDARGQLRTRSGMRRWGFDMMPAARLTFVISRVRRTHDPSLQWRFVRAAPLVAFGAFIGWVQAWSTWLAGHRSTAVSPSSPAAVAGFSTQHPRRGANP